MCQQPGAHVSSIQCVTMVCTASRSTCECRACTLTGSADAGLLAIFGALRQLQICCRRRHCLPSLLATQG